MPWLSSLVQSLRLSVTRDLVTGHHLVQAIARLGGGCGQIDQVRQSRGHRDQVSPASSVISSVPPRFGYESPSRAMLLVTRRYACADRLPPSGREALVKREGPWLF